MKSLVMIFWTMVMMVVAGQAFGQAQTTLVKTIALDNNTPMFALAGEVNVTEYDGDVIRITATVEVKNSTETILQRLVSLGRYNIEVKAENGQLTISTPKMANHIAIQGTDLIEVVRYEISVPRGTQHQLEATYYSNVLTPAI